MERVAFVVVLVGRVVWGWCLERVVRGWCLERVVGRALGFVCECVREREAVWLVGRGNGDGGRGIDLCVGWMDGWMGNSPQS